jgi:hypothetical protein
VPAHVDRTALRVRAGLGLFVLSWLPVAQVVIVILGLHAHEAQVLRVTIWVIQWVIGVVGLVIAGKAVATVVRRSGWRRTPRLLWQMLRTGQVADDAAASTHARRSPDVQR